MNLPPFVYSLRFWEGFSWLLAGVIALLVYFGVLDAKYLYDAGAILAWILAVLRFVGVVPELRARGLL